MARRKTRKLSFTQDIVTRVTAAYDAGLRGSEALWAASVGLKQYKEGSKALRPDRKGMRGIFQKIGGNTSLRTASVAAGSRGKAQERRVQGLGSIPRDPMPELLDAGNGKVTKAPRSASLQQLIGMALKLVAGSETGRRGSLGETPISYYLRKARGILASGF